MLENQLNNYHQTHEINLFDLLDILWSEKLKITFITSIFAILAVFYSLSIPNQYRATALLAPVNQQSGGLSGPLAQLGGLASFAGLSFGGGGDISEAKVAQEIMKSWSFIESFISDNDLSKEIYAAKGWSILTGKIEIDNDVYDVSNEKWLTVNKDTGKVGPPSSWELFKKFTEKLEIAEDKISGLTSVSIEYYSPVTAKNWLDKYVVAINEHMQERQLVKVSNNIEFLMAQIEKTSIAELRGVFYTIIEEQVKAKMLAEASPDYAFVAVSPSMVPEEKSQPKRALICLLITFIGGMLACIFVLAMNLYRKS